MSAGNLLLSSLANPRVKDVVRLRQRSHRDAMGLLLIEGAREIQRALAAGHVPAQLFFCPDLFTGSEEQVLLADCRGAGAELFECALPVFRKMAYRENPGGLLAIAPQLRLGLDDLRLSAHPLLLVTEAVEKPGNLGTMLRSADGAGADAVIVCDPRTDINNPNVVRASLGTLFSMPVVAASLESTQAWLKRNGIRVIAATPHSSELYHATDMTGPTAIVVGTEQEGLSESWSAFADASVRLPMRGKADSLNVAAAAAVLLYEAVRQRA